MKIRIKDLNQKERFCQASDVHTYHGSNKYYKNSSTIPFEICIGCYDSFEVVEHTNNIKFFFKSLK